MAEPTATKVFCAMHLLRELSIIDSSTSSGILRTTEDLLLGTFKAYSQIELIVPQEFRPEASSLLSKSLPNLKIGLSEFCYGFNADKRVGAQCYLSALKFIADDFKTSDLDALLNSDEVEEMQELIKNSKDSPPWVPDEIPDLRNVPRSHIWWKDEFES